MVTVKSAVGLGNGVLTVFPLLAGLYGVGSLGAGLLFAVRGAGALVGPLVMRPVLNHRSWLLPGLVQGAGVLFLRQPLFKAPDRRRMTSGPGASLCHAQKRLP